MLSPKTLSEVEAWSRRSAASRVSTAEVAELAQDVLTRIHRYCDQRPELARLIEGGGKSAERYVSRATINAAADRHTAVTRRTNAERQAAGGVSRPIKRPGVFRPAARPVAPDTVEQIVNRMLVDRAIELSALLTPHQRMYFEMFHQQGLSPSEVARACGVSRQAVSKSLKEAFATIRAGLGETH